MEFLLNNLFWSALVVVSGALYLWNLLRSEGGDLSPQAAVGLINRDSGIVVDVREAAIYGESHMAGARNIPVAQLESRLSELEKFKTRPIVVCGAGGEADRAVRMLRKQGFDKAAGLAGGLKAWNEAGFPVER
ncbi:MAG: rhodanese-like domain-containing protein [Rhodocyclaceae bacterium]|nr:rhodanese-like domain-containing protein [Rhodocyclaceae bacterium]